MSRMGNFLARLRRRPLTPGQYWLLLTIAGWNLASRALIPLLSLTALMRLLTPRRPTAPVTPEAMNQANQLDLYIRIVLRLNPENIGKMCLRRSLLLYRFLRRAGLPARLCIGVRRENDALQGHAWIEIEGRHFNDTLADVPYTVTFSFPDRV